MKIVIIMKISLILKSQALVKLFLSLSLQGFSKKLLQPISRSTEQVGLSLQLRSIQALFWRLLLQVHNYWALSTATESNLHKNRLYTLGRLLVSWWEPDETVRARSSYHSKNWSHNIDPETLKFPGNKGWTQASCRVH